MKLGENEAARELMARLIEMLRLEAEEEAALLGACGEKGTPCDPVSEEPPERASSPMPALADGLPSEWIRMISRALSRSCPGGQVSILLGGRQANGLHALVIAELEKEWKESVAHASGENASEADRASRMPEEEAGAPAGAGSIEVDSVAGLGTTFTIHLPEE
ncbi:hypothetical protein [Cohnella sp. AR92]|uniref:hypothetical protein n=1 Tax=Cohnella sp. AR92 TaxID=648716 RepID=UPI000F8D0A7F|nr:hypothetical protein [Cohnella sp. AR92]RUS42856.1 hypothetical protein ELR57_25970 [Cohnella sp. AR92]